MSLRTMPGSETRLLPNPSGPASRCVTKDQPTLNCYGHAAKVCSLSVSKAKRSRATGKPTFSIPTGGTTGLQPTCMHAKRSLSASDATGKTNVSLKRTFDVNNTGFGVGSISTTGTDSVWRAADASNENVIPAAHNDRHHNERNLKCRSSSTQPDRHATGGVAT